MPSTVPRAPRRNRSFWLDHVRRWQNSGLSKSAYCRRHSINVGSFYNWCGKLDKECVANAPSDESRSTELSFLPVTIASTTSPVGQFIRVERFGTDINLPADLAPEQIHRWLAAIHQLDV